jgi:hypothetical protein
MSNPNILVVALPTFTQMLYRPQNRLGFKPQAISSNLLKQVKEDYGLRS